MPLQNNVDVEIVRRYAVVTRRPRWRGFPHSVVASGGGGGPGLWLAVWPLKAVLCWRGGSLHSSMSYASGPASRNWKMTHVRQQLKTGGGFKEKRINCNYIDVTRLVTYTQDQCFFTDCFFYRFEIATKFSLFTNYVGMKCAFFPSFPKKHKKFLLNSRIFPLT